MPNACSNKDNNKLGYALAISPVLTISVILLFSSFILRYNVYYLIVATITTSLSLYSHFNTKFNAKNIEDII